MWPYIHTFIIHTYKYMYNPSRTVDGHTLDAVCALASLARNPGGTRDGTRGEISRSAIPCTKLNVYSWTMKQRRAEKECEAKRWRDEEMLQPRPTDDAHLPWARARTRQLSKIFMDFSRSGSVVPEHYTDTHIHTWNGREYSVRRYSLRYSLTHSSPTWSSIAKPRGR